MAPDSGFLLELWILYSIGVLWLLLRLGVRIRTLGIFSLHLDDLFSVLVLGSWTVTCVNAHMLHCMGTSAVLVPSDDPETMASRIQRAEYARKLNLSSWHAYILQLWCLKGTVLVFYRHIAISRWQDTLLKFTTWFCALTFIALMAFLTFSCLPYQNNWRAWPPPVSWCKSKQRLLIVTSCFNASTDVLLLAIPIPLIWKLSLPPLKRAGVVILLSSGVFVLAACITRVTLSISPHASSTTTASWGARELFIGILSVNTAILRPVFRKSFWTSKSSPFPRQGNYIFISRNRMRKLFARRLREHNDMINSTSAGLSTVEEYNRQDSHYTSVTFEDPNYQVAVQSKNMSHAPITSRTRSASPSQVRTHTHGSSRWSSFWNRNGTEAHKQPQQEIDLERRLERGEATKQTHSSGSS